MDPTSYFAGLLTGNLSGMGATIVAIGLVVVFCSKRGSPYKGRHFRR